MVAAVVNVKGKSELLNALYHQLQFPGYFGFNWDAMNDCLRDFSWPEPYKAVTIIHPTVPDLNAAEPDAYLYLYSPEYCIADVQQQIKEAGTDAIYKHPLEAIFPLIEKQRLEAAYTG
ncbi:MAG: barstar family protein [Bacteroidota bacterium]